MIYHVLSNDENRKLGDYLVPVTDGSYFTESSNKKGDDIFMEHQTGDFALCFYASDGVTPVTPTGGTITPYMEHIKNVWQAPGVGDASIDATSVIAESDGIATYSVPVFLGGAIRGRMDLLGITGATYVKAQFRRFR